MRIVAADGDTHLGEDQAADFYLLFSFFQKKKKNEIDAHASDFFI